MKQVKKIVYVTSTRLPTEKAHGLATIKICEAFVGNGCEVEIIAPSLWRKDKGDIFKYYDIKDNFKIVKIPCIDLIPIKVFEKVAFILQSISFSFFLIPYIILKYKNDIKNIIFFSHDYIPLYFMTFLSNKVFYDIHHFPGDNFIYKRVMEKSFGFSSQTKWKTKALSDKFFINPKKIVYWPNGTDVNKFRVGISREMAKIELGIPPDKKIVMYTGQLFNWKGVDSLIKSVKILPRDFLIYIVGGARSDVDNYKNSIMEASNERVIFVPFQPHHKIPLWLKAADVLVLPNTGKQKVSLHYTSPMKLFEYMASGTPIVATRIPSIEEIVNEEEVFFAEPDNPDSLAKQIQTAVTSGEIATKKGEKAMEVVSSYTWLARAKKIEDHITSLLPTT